MVNSKKIIFFGSDDFAQVHLAKLLLSEHKVVACVTQPDKPKDRGMKLFMSPIKETALTHEVPVLQPERLKENTEIIHQLKAFDADIFVVIAYGRFLTPELLNLPKICAVNVHGSLLPKYRGAAPINWAIINGEKESGLSIIRLNTGMDAGEILAQKKITIEEEDTAVTLRQKMMVQGPDLLLKVLDQLPDISGTPQKESEITFAPKLTKELGLLDWTLSADHLRSLVRGLQPWPSAYTFLNGEQLKILKAGVETQQCCVSTTCGQVLKVDNNGIHVHTGKGILLIQELQPSGKKPMDAASFLRGHALPIGLILG